jgi:hypothetical protein
LKVPASEQMIDDIDKECRTVTLIETVSQFTFSDNVVELNRSEPGLTVLEDIDRNLEKFGKSGTPADFTVYFVVFMIFLLPSFLIIMILFNINLDLMPIYRDICAN